MPRQGGSTPTRPEEEAGGAGLGQSNRAVGSHWVSVQNDAGDLLRETVGSWRSALESDWTTRSASHEQGPAPGLLTPQSNDRVSQGRGTEHEGDCARHEGDRAIFISSGRETKSTNRGGHIDGQRDAVPPAPGTGDTSHTNERSTWANP